MSHPVRSWRARLVRPFAACLAAATLTLSLAHGWEELDPRRALAEADAVLAVAAAVQGGWADRADGAVPAGDASWPAELRWWRWFETRLAADGDAAVVEAIRERAPAWLSEVDERDAAGWWFDALAEVVAHAAARSVDASARVAAAAVLGRPTAAPAEAELASWLLVLPVLDDAERRGLAPAFARLDALVAEVLP